MADAAAVSIRDVGMTYGEGAQAVEALSEISLDVMPGEFLAIVGPSGCGKSTLLRLVTGLRRPTRGDIMMSGGSPASRDREMRSCVMLKASTTTAEMPGARGSRWAWDCRKPS